MRRLSLGLWLLLAGCADDMDALTAPLADPALLETLGNEYSCQVEQPIARWYDNRWQGGRLIRQGDHWAVFNGQSHYNSSESDEHAILVRTVDAQGTPGLPRSFVRATLTSRVNGIAQAGGKTALVWSGVDVGQDEYRNMLVVLGESGEPLGPSRAVGPIATRFVASVQSNAARVAAADGGWALLVTSTDSQRVTFLRVNDAGEPLGEPREIMRTQGDFIASNLVRFGDGYAATWATLVTAYLVLLDAHGEPTAGPWSIGTHTRGQALLVRGDELVLAYSLSEPGVGSLRLARFDRSGRIVGGVRDVQPPGFGRSVEDPALGNFGDDIALMWSEGTPIENCAGCVLDNTLKLVVLGGTDGLPKSGVVELTNPIAKAALMRPQLGTDSERLLILANMEWHVPMDGASAVVRCTP